MQKPTSPSASMERGIHIFNTFFYEKLKQDVLTKVASETLGAPIYLVNQFNSSYGHRIFSYSWHKKDVNVIYNWIDHLVCLM